MIEVLITMIVLLIGLLGIASLQAVAKQSVHQSVQRVRAIALADSIIERIRLNPTAIEVYAKGLDNPFGNSSIASEPTPNCKTQSCTAVQLAAYDLWQWERDMDGAGASVNGNNSAGLIAPRGCISFTANSGKNHTGTVSVFMQWRGLKAIFDAVQAGENRCGGEAEASDKRRRQVRIDTFVVDQNES